VVQGTGLHVDSIGGGVAAPGGAVGYHKWCGYIGVTIQLNGTYYRSVVSPYGCADSFAPYNYNDYPNANYPNGSQACLWAYTDSGYHNPGGPACAIIHS
jgi:hypothetical protein